MRLYSGSTRDFIEDNVHNRIAFKLSEAFQHHFRYAPPASETRAWRNSLRAMSQVIQTADLLDNGIMVEYQIPLTSKRLDCLISGVDDDARDSAVIVELKQWDRCEPADGENLVSTKLRGRPVDVLHPSAQAGQYKRYLTDCHTAFHEAPNPVSLDSCAYLHNYLHDDQDPLFAPKFRNLLADTPTFTGDGVTPLSEFLARRLAGGEGLTVLRRIERSKYRPSKQLMDHVAAVIGGEPTFVLLDDQLVVYDKVKAAISSGLADRKKHVVLVHGGPGTGKSVVAINLMADLLRSGFNAHYATGSRAFTETLRKVVGRRAAAQFKYFNSYQDAQFNDVDVLICDEAHRIRKVSANRFTPKHARTGKPQIEELIQAAKISVFFIDDRQVVRPDEIGSSPYICKFAKEAKTQLSEHALEVQFRCAGSDGFVNWVNNTLGIERTANVIWEGNDDFDFRIIGSPEELDRLIRKRAAEGSKARLTAGFCWPWSKQANPDGTLVADVEIGSFRRPWNARPEARKLPPGVPKASLWANEPGGLDQVGCIYTAQGFEFDYAGVIWGRDLVYSFDEQKWVSNKKESFDQVVKRSGDQFVELVKNTYRVLLSRGLKGCYVCFLDRETERFVRSRIEMPDQRQVAEDPSDYA